LVTTLLSAQSAAPQFPNPGNPHMSRDDQRALGLQAAAQVYKQMPVLPDSSPETQYIRQLGNKLVATIPPEYSWPFEFHVVAQKEINAFALPGGPMFVNIGTITAAANEAELAGVMAHEMSHVIMQHSAKQADKAQWTGLFAGLASVAAGATLGGGMLGQAAQMGIGVTAQGISLKYSRGDESQADAVGAIIMYKAGYNPQAMADFFQTLESQSAGAPPQLLSDHPDPGNRSQAIEKEIRNWPPEQYASNSPAFEKVKQQAMGVKAYTGEEIAAGAKSGQWAALNQKNGAVFKPTGAAALNTSAPAPSGAAPSAPATSVPATPTVPAVSLRHVQPSGKLVPTDLGRIKIVRPDNWQVMMPKQQGDSLKIAPQAGVTSGAVGYGVVINGAMPEEQGLGIDQITEELVQQMERTGTIKSVGKLQTVAVNGVQGRAVVMQSQSPFRNPSGQPQPERDWLITVPQHDGSVIFMVFVAPEAEFSLFEPSYQAMLKSVQF
jgi:Zn-dependent protease with chaperone function